MNAVGEYELTMTDLINICTISDIISVIEFENVLTVDSLFQKICTSSGNYNLDATSLAFDSPDFTYAWTTTTGTIVSGADQRVPIINSTGDYNITFTDVNSGCVFVDNVMVTDTVIPPIPIIIIDSYFTCDNQEVELNAQSSILNNPVNYSWIDPLGNIISTTDLSLIHI